MRRLLPIRLALAPVAAAAPIVALRSGRACAEMTGVT